MEVHDPYAETTKRDQDLLHQRETERIKLHHQRRLKIIQLIETDWSGFAVAGGIITTVGGLIISLILLFPACNESRHEQDRQRRELIDTCIREGTNAKNCECAFSDIGC